MDPLELLKTAGSLLLLVAVVFAVRDVARYFASKAGWAGIVSFLS